ncbi:MAG: peptide-methionine (S)-S-oxide reductase MsrA [Bacteroidia bacterium]
MNVSKLFLALFALVSCSYKAPMQDPVKPSLSHAVLAGGCFWCLDAVYREMKGVENVISGYSNGLVKNPTYREVCTGRTGCAEVVRIEYDSSQVTYAELLEVFWRIHNPTTLNRQGNDVGTQYRSGIFYETEEQRLLAEASMSAAQESGLWEDPIVTVIEPLRDFSVAEDYHQDYYRQNPNQPYCTFVVGEKVKKFKELFADKQKGL